MAGAVLALLVFAAFLYIGVPWIYGKCSRILLHFRAVKARALVLTLDDGPGNRLTPEILDLLDKNGVKATFFLLGRNIVGREAIVREIARRGHEICSHGYDHLHCWKVSPLRAISDIKRGWKAIDEALGERHRVYPYRPPGGKLNLICLVYLLFHRIPIAYWTLDSGDTWAAEIRDRQRSAALAAMVGGAVVLAHDFDREDADWERMQIDIVDTSLAAARRKRMKVMPLSELMVAKQRSTTGLSTDTVSSSREVHFDDVTIGE